MSEPPIDPQAVIARLLAENAALKAQAARVEAKDGGTAGGTMAVGRDVNGDVTIHYHLQAQPAAAGVRNPDRLKAAEAYLKLLVESYQYLDLRGMGVSDRVPLKLPILDMYVPLKARLHTPEGETWERRQLRIAPGRPGRTAATSLKR